MSIQECDQGTQTRGRCEDGDDHVFRDGHHVALDHQGSMTMCDLSLSSGSVGFACSTYLFTADNFDSSAQGYLTPQKYRMLDLRLYGPSADHVSYDIEPEGGAFTDDGRYLLINLQDNNGYMIFDVQLNRYISMAGYGYKAMTMDASDRDNGIFIQSTKAGRLAREVGLRPGDQIIECNGASFRNIEFGDAVFHLKSSRKLELLVRKGAGLELLPMLPA